MITSFFIIGRAGAAYRQWQQSLFLKEHTTLVI